MKFTNKHGETKYRYYKKLKDPLTNKWRTSVVLNKNGKQSQKEAQKRLNIRRIEAKLK